MKNSEKTLDMIVNLCKNRGYVYAGSEIYGGLANSWDYGPLGVSFCTIVIIFGWNSRIAFSIRSKSVKVSSNPNPTVLTSQPIASAIPPIP